MELYRMFLIKEMFLLRLIRIQNLDFYLELSTSQNFFLKVNSYEDLFYFSTNCVISFLTTFKLLHRIKTRIIIFILTLCYIYSEFVCGHFHQYYFINLFINLFDSSKKKEEKTIRMSLCNVSTHLFFPNFRVYVYRRCFLQDRHTKKMKIKKFSPHSNHDFYYFFCKSVLSHTL